MNFQLKWIYILTLLLHSLTPPTTAKIPEPDAIIYGTINIGDTLVTAADTGIGVVLKIDDVEIDSYSMGSNTAAGNYYVLTVPMDIYGTQSPGTARPGEAGEILINGTLAQNVIIGDRGSITQLPLALNALVCNSSQSGALLSTDTYIEGPPCGLSYHDYIINDGHTVTWDGSGGALTGSITIRPGGTLKITGAGGALSTVKLDGGVFETDYDLSLKRLEVIGSSSVDVAYTRTLSVTDRLYISPEKQLTLTSAGMLKILNTFQLLGMFDAGAATVDLRGTHIILNNSLNLAGASLLTDQTTHLFLNKNVTLTTDQPVFLGTLDLNNYSLTLGSANSDLTVHQHLVLDHQNEKIITGNADLTLAGELYLSDGSIESTGGVLSINNGGEMSGGILDATGTQFVVSGGFVNTGGQVITDPASQSTPMANAGENQTVVATSDVVLDGSGSIDPDGSISSWHWKQTAGSPVILVNPDQAQSSFTSPAISQDMEELTFRLTVTDNDGLTTYATTSVYVTTAETYTVTVVKQGQGLGMVTSDPAGLACGTDCESVTRSYAKNTVVTLSAAADANSIFNGWTGTECNHRESCRFTLDGNKTLQATFISPTTLTQTMVNSGIISAGAGPYRVRENLFVTPEKRVHLEAGTRVFFDRDIKLEVSGRLSVLGIPSNKVVFTATEPSEKWHGLNFTPSHDGSSTLRSLDILYAYSGVHLNCCGNSIYTLQIVGSGFYKNQAAIKGFAAYRVNLRDSILSDNNIGLFGTRRVDVDNCQFIGNQIAALGEQGRIRYSSFSNNSLALQNSLEGMVLQNSSIENNVVGIEIVDPSGGAVSSPAFSISDSNITGNSLHNLKNQQSQSLNLPGNWWGSTDILTIMQTIYDHADDIAVGTIDPVAFLSQPATTVPAGPSGLKGDIDADNLVTSGDATLYTQCIEHRTRVASGENESLVDHDLGITYQNSCTRLTDLDGDSTDTTSDAERLDRCVKHKIFTDLGLDPSLVDSELGIIFTTDCAAAYSTW